MVDVEYRESDEKYIRAMGKHPDPVVTAVELADIVDVSQQAAYTKLADLEDRGLVTSKKVGARSKVWWLTTAGVDVYREVDC